MNERRQLGFQADRIEALLALHKCTVRVTGGTVPPRWVRFQVLPAMGTKVSKVKELAEEIAAALDASSVRVSRRDAALAVEVPRDDPRPVRLLPLLRQLDGDVPEVTACLGLDEDGAPLLIRLPSPDMVHVLVAGTTGSGKTVLLRAMALSLALRHPSPRDLVLVMIDPKGGAALGDLAGLPHLARPVILDAEEATEALASLVRLMERRDRRRENHPPVVVIIDELADLLMVGGKSVQVTLTRLTQRGRGAGIHLVGATQKPTAAVLGPLVKANFPVRLVGHVANIEDERTAGARGASRLLGRGDFLAVAEGRLTRFQAAYISHAEVAETLARRGWHAPPRVRGGDNGRRPVSVEPEPVRAGVGALDLSSIRPFPHKWMDDRLVFCGAVREYCKGLPRDTEGCTSYPKCGLTGGGPCAFDDPGFDWEKGQEIAATQPLIVDSVAVILPDPPEPEPEPVDLLAQRLRAMEWDLSQPYRAAARALGEAEGGRCFYLVQEAVNRLREGATATATTSESPFEAPTAPMVFSPNGSGSTVAPWALALLDWQTGGDDV